MTKSIAPVITGIAFGGLLGCGDGASAPVPEENAAASEARADDGIPGPINGERVNRLELTRYARDTKQRTKIVLVKDARGWRLNRPVDYPADADLVGKMLAALSDLEVTRVIPEQKDRLHSLGLDDRLGIEVAAFFGEEVRLDMIVGASVGGRTAARLPGKETVFELAGMHRPTFDRTARHLRERRVLRLDRGSVSRIKYRHGGKELTVVREGEGETATYAPVGVKIKNFDQRLAAKHARGLTALTTRDFVDEPIPDDRTGLGAGALHIELDATNQGVKGTYRVEIGNDTPHRTTYLRTSQSDQIFLVPTYKVAYYRIGADDFARSDKEVARERKALEEQAAHNAQHRRAARRQREHEKRADGPNPTGHTH